MGTCENCMQYEELQNIIKKLITFLSIILIVDYYFFTL
jgi:hypothetical protein